jgi:hypothetical protein
MIDGPKAKSLPFGRLFLFFYPKFRIPDPENKPAKILGLESLLYQCLLL